MKKIALLLLSLLLIFSFTGCLKDDYEALEMDIESLNDDIDSISKEVSKEKELIHDYKNTLLELNAENALLVDELSGVEASKELVENKLNTNSDLGLEFNKFEFENGFFSIVDMVDSFDGVSMSFLPQHNISDGIHRLIYQLSYKDEIYEDMMYVLTLCPDKEHIKSVSIISTAESAEANADVFGKFHSAMCFATVMAIEKSFNQINFDTQIVLDLVNGLPIYNSIIIEYEEEELYIGTIKEISK